MDTQRDGFETVTFLEYCDLECTPMSNFCGLHESVLQVLSRGWHSDTHLNESQKLYVKKAVQSLCLLVTKGVDYPPVHW